MVGNSAGLRWQGKFLTDEWGRKIYEESTISATSNTLDKEGTSEYIVTQPRVNPDWDPQKEYISRSERPEWAAVGLLGQILIRDDGTCEVNGYCMPNDEGVATAAMDGYRILRRTGNNQVLIMFK